MAHGPNDHVDVAGTERSERHWVGSTSTNHKKSVHRPQRASGFGSSTCSLSLAQKWGSLGLKSLKPKNEEDSAKKNNDHPAHSSEKIARNAAESFF